MCADLDPAPRPPTLTKDTTLKVDCTGYTQNEVTVECYVIMQSNASLIFVGKCLGVVL